MGHNDDSRILFPIAFLVVDGMFGHDHGNTGLLSTANTTQELRIMEDSRVMLDMKQPQSSGVRLMRRHLDERRQGIAQESSIFRDATPGLPAWRP